MWVRAAVVFALVWSGLAGRQLAAQVIELTAGASTAYGAEGGSIVLHGEDSETSLGAGLVMGHLEAGGSSTRRIEGGSMTVGSQQFRVDVPTDVFDTSHILFGTGLGYRLFTEASPTANAFVGFSSQEGGTPLFRTVTLDQTIAFGQWMHPVGDHCRSTFTGLFSTMSALLASVECRRSPEWSYAMTAGVGAGAPYAAASVTVSKRRFKMRAAYVYSGSGFQRGNDLEQPEPEPVRENVSALWNVTRNISLSGSHQHYATRWISGDELTAVSLVPERSELDSAALVYQGRKGSAGVTLLHSSSVGTVSDGAGSNEAISLNFRKELGRLHWTENYFRSLSQGSATSSILISGVAADLNTHLRLTESVNVSNAGVSFSHGGALRTSYSSFEVDYQLFYLATRPQQPFEQALVFDAQVRLPKNLALHAASAVQQTGQTRYTFQLSTFFARNGSAPEPISQGGLGLNIIEGRVVDERGRAVEGAALMIGNDRVYSDAGGYFFYREKRAAVHTMKLLPDEFLGMGSYVGESVPAQVRSGQRALSTPVLIIVRGVTEGTGSVLTTASNDDGARVGKP